MSVDGRFNGTDCMSVTWKDGKTIWIFKPEDLREVVPEDVYKCFEEFLRVSAEDKLEDWLRDRDVINERVEDGYLQMCISARNELEEIIQFIDMAPRASKKFIEEVRSRLKHIYRDLNSNL